MKLAVIKKEDIHPGNYNYLLMPYPLDNAKLVGSRLLGHVVLDVSDEEGHRLIHQSKQALAHQVEIARLAEEVLAK